MLQTRERVAETMELLSGDGACAVGRSVGRMAAEDRT